MKTMIRIVTVLALLCFSTALGDTIFSMKMCLAEQRDWYVAMDGDDTNDGTFEQPLKTIQMACDRLMPGDTLYIMEGIYFQKIKVTKSGLADKMITIKPYENANVVLDGTNFNGDVMVEIKNQSYIRIEGLTICNSQTDNNEDVPMGIFVHGSGEYIELSNNTINNIHTLGNRTDLNAHGIAVYGTKSNPLRNITIENNHIYDCTLGNSEAMVVNGNVDVFNIINNTVHDVDNIGIDCIGFEKVSKGGIDQARNGYVAHNTVYNIDSASNPAYMGEGCADGIYVDGGRDIIIESNNVSNCNIGIEVASEHKGKQTENVTVINNIVTNSNLYGLAIGGAGKQNGEAVNCLLANNTLYQNDITIAIQQARDNVISSNIFYGGANDLVEGKIDENLFEQNVWYSQNEHYKEEWMYIFTDPLFINSQQEDYQLLPASPPIDAGSDRITTITSTDYFGNERNIENVDCGAIEMSLEKKQIIELPEPTEQPKEQENKELEKTHINEIETDKRESKEIEITVDQSWFYTIQTKGNDDTYGELIKPNGRVIKVDDDSGVEMNFLMRRWLWKNKSYTVWVESSSAETIDLHVDRVKFLK